MRFWWLCLLAAGCTISREDYPAKYTRAWCNAYEECFQADFDSMYEGQKECREEVLPSIEDAADALDVFGDYDEEHAVECIHRMRTASCEEYREDVSFSECEGVWHD